MSGILLSLIAAAALSFSPLRILSFFLILYVVARLIPVSLGLIGNLVLSFTLLCASLGALSLFTWLLKIQLDSAPILIFLIALLLVYVRFILKKIPPFWPDKHDRFNFDDIASLVLSLLVCSIFLVPLFQSFQTATLGQLVLFNGDNSTHFELLKANDLNKGPAYGLENDVNTFKDAASYPQSWHFFGAFSKWLSEPLVNFDSSTGKILFLFYSLAIIWFTVFIFLTCRLGIFLGRLITKSQSKLSALGPVAVTSIATLGWLITFFAYGFQTQTAALCLLLAELLILVDATRLPATKRYFHLRLAFVLACGSTLMWVLIAPISLLLVAAGYLTTISVKQRRFPPLADWLIFLIFGGLTIMQMCFRFLFPLSHYQTESYLNSLGLVAKIDLYWLGVGLLLSTIYVLIRQAKALWVVYFTGLLATLLSSLILIYQLNTVGEPRYFYFKVNFALFIALIVLIGCLSFEAFEAVFQKKKIKKSLLSIYVFLFAVCLGLCAWGVRSPLVNDYLQKRAFGVESRQAAAVIDISNKSKTDGYKVMSVGSCNRANDIRTMQLSWMLSFSSLPSTGLYEPLRMYTHDQNLLFDHIKKFQQRNNTTPIVLINDQIRGNELKEFLGDQAQHFKFINIDPDPNTETVEQCPDRIRPFPVTTPLDSQHVKD